MISVKNLVKKYGYVPSVNSISFDVKEKTIFGFIGPNGAGKSTTLNILTYLVKPTSGEITINDLDHQNYSFDIKKIIGVMPEKLPLFDYLTGQEYLNYIGDIYGLTKDEINIRMSELFTYLDIDEAKNRFINGYSQGMKKKISFAAAIMHNLKYLFLDEPFENIDPLSRKKMKIVLNKMKEKGTTIFITSHALKEVEDFCDEVAIINKGKIVYQSETKDIRNKIKNEVTNETYQSLEEIFLDLTAENESITELSWL
ncbi:MAG: ABC transporter ATP-binding protein [Ignavibacteria bacterium]|nr:ABC transporter ATP-binding protein [Ignavibacteria bacterium]